MTSCRIAGQPWDPRLQPLGDSEVRVGLTVLDTKCARRRSGAINRQVIKNKIKGIGTANKPTCNCEGCEKPKITNPGGITRAIAVDEDIDAGIVSRPQPINDRSGNIAR